MKVKYNQLTSPDTSVLKQFQLVCDILYKLFYVIKTSGNISNLIELNKKLHEFNFEFLVLILRPPWADFGGQSPP